MVGKGPQMTSPEVLKLLTARTVGLELGSGGEPELTPQMVAAAKAKISPAASALADWKYLHVRSDPGWDARRHKAELNRYILLGWVVDLALERDWKAGKLREMIDLAIDEVCCNQRFSYRQRARRLDVASSTYQRVASQYEAILGVVGDLDGELREALKALD